MKIIKLTLTLLCASVPLWFSSLHAASVVDYGYVTKRSTGTTLANVIFPANSEKSIRLVTVDLQSDLPTATVTYRGGTERARVNASGATGQAVIEVVNSGLINTNDIVVVQKGPNTATSGATFRGVVSTVASFTNITLAANLSFAVVAGDLVYRMSDISTVRPASTNELRQIGQAVFAAQLRQPVIVEVDGTSACRINNVTAKYDPD